MKRIILSKMENELLLHCLEELIKFSSDVELIDQKWISKIEPTLRQFNLELAYFKIRDDYQIPTKKQLIEWLIFKIKNKTADLS